MMTTPYAIADEPQPRALVRFAVNPFWPLLAFMFAGVWASWSWFLFNGYIVGSPTFGKECRIAMIGLAGAVIFFGIGGTFLGSHGYSVANPSKYLPYLLSVLLLWKLWISYLLLHEQSRTFEIFLHYGGTVRNGVFAMIAAALFSPVVVKALAQIHPLLGHLLG
jgi:hypothetical protein